VGNSLTSEAFTQSNAKDNLCTYCKYIRYIFTKFWWESPKERDHLEDQVVEGCMRSQWILRRLAGGVDWIRLAQDMDRWRALVNAVMNLRILHGVS
jgi:hypothetical protein